MDFLVAGGAILLLALIAAWFVGSISKYGSGEWEAMKADAWGDEERVARLIRKRADAIQKMRKHGIPTLYEGHKGWATVNPMAVKNEPAPIIQFRRKPK